MVERFLKKVVPNLRLQTSRFWRSLFLLLKLEIHPAKMHAFQPVAIQTSRGDGYFIEAFPFKNDGGQSPPNVIAYGLGGSQISVVSMFVNPYPNR